MQGFLALRPETGSIKRDALVWQAVGAMFAQAGRDDLDGDAIRSLIAALIAAALGRLRGVAGGD